MVKVVGKGISVMFIVFDEVLLIIMLVVLYLGVDMVIFVVLLKIYNLLVIKSVVLFIMLNLGVFVVCFGDIINVYFLVRKS